MGVISIDYSQIIHIYFGIQSSDDFFFLLIWLSECDVVRVVSALRIQRQALQTVQIFFDYKKIE